MSAETKEDNQRTSLDGHRLSIDDRRPSLDDQRLSLDGEHDPYFEPIISLPLVKASTLEEDETILHKARAKLFRHDRIDKEWKERGTGEVKLLHHEKNETVRIVMRRDKTLKLCANHYVTSEMMMNPKSGSDRAFVWTTNADVADDVPKSEILAIRFMNTEAASKWKEKFEEAKKIVKESLKPKYYKNDDEDEGVSSEATSSENEEENEVLEKVKEMTLQENTSTELNSEKPSDDPEKSKELIKGPSDSPEKNRELNDKKENDKENIVS